MSNQPPPPWHNPQQWPVQQPFATPNPFTPRPRRRTGLVVVAATVAAGAVLGGAFYIGLQNGTSDDATESTNSRDEEEIRSVIDIYAAESDFAKARTIMCASLVDHTLADRTEAQASAVYRRDMQQVGSSNVDSYEKVEISYDRARATVVGHTDGGATLPAIDPLRYTIGLVKEGGAWKVCTDPEFDTETTNRIRNEADKVAAADSLTEFFERIAAQDLIGMRNSTCGDLAAILGTLTPEAMPQFAEAVGTINSVDESTVTGDAATVTVSLDSVDGPAVAAYSMIRSGDTWKVCQEKVLV